MNSRFTTALLAAAAFQYGAALNLNKQTDPHVSSTIVDMNRDDLNCPQPDNIWAWLKCNYLSKQRGVTHDARNVYYKLLRIDISEMISRIEDLELFEEMGYDTDNFG